MSAETILSYMVQGEYLNPFLFHTVSQCAPVFKGVKVSNMISASKGSWASLKKMLRGTGIICIPLSLREREVLFIYHFQLFNRLLEDQNVCDFLREQGYGNLDLASVILRLKRRFEEYLMESTSFPHELGVFLGYPPEDVKSFVIHQGKDFLFSGYWKVYHKPDRAARIFDSYDQTRREALEELLAGLSLREIIRSIV